MKAVVKKKPKRARTARTPRPVPAMTSKTPLGEALRSVLEALLGYAKEQSAAASLAGEPVRIHDYRVGIRILRAQISAFKNVLPRTAADRMQNHLRRLARETSELRDLDVLLDARKRLEALVSGADRKVLAPLFEHVSQRRDSERQRVIARLRAPLHRRTLTAVKSAIPTLCGAVTGDGITARQGALEAQQRQVRKLARLARRVQKDPSDANLHALRIAGKKVRYLYEMFQCALPARTTRAALKRLEAVQDILGQAHDRECQRTALLGTLEELQGGSPEVANAAVRLAKALGRIQKSHRREVVAVAKAIANGNARAMPL